MNINHLKLAHLIWKEHLKPGMKVIDATAGNGHDTLFLANQVLRQGMGWVHAFDIQEKALANTKELLKGEPFLDRISFYHQSHETFPEGLSDIDLIAYNLGYLPGGDKNITTRSNTTLTSCQNALKLLKRGGLLSIMLYASHSQGFEERSLLLPWLETLSSSEYFILSHSPINIPNLPSLITLQKR